MYLDLQRLPVVVPILVAMALCGFMGALNGWAVKVLYLIIYAIGMAIIMWFVWNKTKIGKNMFAIGGNPEAAEVSAVNVARNIMILQELVV